MVVNIIKNRIGETKLNQYNNKMTIIEYNSATDILVKFSDDSIKKSEYSKFKKGEIKSLYDKTVYGVGYIGEGKYKSKINSISTKQYTTWQDMLNRCYSDKKQEKCYTYRECTVSDEWHNFQNFAKWYDENYYEIDNQKMDLDKDILVKGNKLYSPETCVFVPHNINGLFTKSNSIRGNLPIGVTKNGNKFQAKCNKDRKIIGNYDTPQTAFLEYKRYKEEHIKEIAEKYKKLIPSDLYDVMCKYEVNIVD